MFPPITRDDVFRIETPRLWLLVIEHKSTRTVIGTVLVRFGQDQRPYIGYALHPDFWGQGYASEAAKALVDVVFLLTDTDAMTATARSDNAASHHVLTKLGFVAQAER
ncbi:MAG: N-acetyltransferase, partial [Proteobacteria bacterium]|nr:N-acetyltransferase [Pseudomonadota bacterium]